VRGQGRGFAQAVWYHKRWLDVILVLDWTGIADAEKESLVRCGGFGKRSERGGGEEDLDRGDAGGDGLKTDVRELSERDSRWNECRAGCGEKNSRLVCSRCKETRELQSSWYLAACYLTPPTGYCSSVCQQEDWKVSLGSFVTRPRCYFLLRSTTSRCAGGISSGPSQIAEVF
jgi:hypothetical protein